jgi:hypothetical protein
MCINFDLLPYTMLIDQSAWRRGIDAVALTKPWRTGLPSPMCLAPGHACGGRLPQRRCEVGRPQAAAHRLGLAPQRQTDRLQELALSLAPYIHSCIERFGPER